MEDFIYWRHPTLPGIKVEEVTGGDEFHGKAWFDAARQIYSENGREEYREIGHYPCGAPFLYNGRGRISVTHCAGLLAVATLPDTPEVNLGVYSDRAALGIDAERADRAQVLRLRDRFLNAPELDAIDKDSVEQNILAWTVKEACYKLAMAAGLDFRNNIIIERMPRLGPPTPVYDLKEFSYDGTGSGFRDDDYGMASIIVPAAEGAEQAAGGEITLKVSLFSYRSDDFIITLAFHRLSARFSKKHSDL